MIGLTIAGFDPSGGAGISTDIKTMAAHGVHACAAVTALTAQNPKKVFSVEPISTDYISQQIDSIFDEYSINANMLISSLLERIKHVNTKHDVSENALVRNTVREKKEEFLRTFRNVKGYGIYGSFAMGKENEYSDLDMLVISDDGRNYNLENEISAFWHRYFSIDIDVKIVKEDDIDQELTECMKRTLRMVA